MKRTNVSNNINTTEKVSRNEAKECITKLIHYIGEDPNKDELKNTPERVIAAFDEFFSGYRIDMASIFSDATIEHNENTGKDDIILFKDVDFISTCEHHLERFYGTVHVAYIPNGKIIGLGRIAKVIDSLSRRLQIQERLTTEITNAIWDWLKPRGIAVIIKATHNCITTRGSNKKGSSLITESFLGVLSEDSNKARIYNMILT